MNVLNLKDYIDTIVSIKFLPNYKDTNNSLIVRNYNFNVELYKKYYSYVYHENEIKILQFSKTIRDYLNNCLTSFYGTKNGVFISKDNYDEHNFYAYSNIGNIYTNKKEINFYKSSKFLLTNGEIILTETINKIVYHEHINFMSMKTGIDIIFNIKLKMGFLDYVNLHYEYGDPIFKTEDDKNIILSKYENCGNILDIIEQYESENNLINLSDEEIKIIKQQRFIDKAKQIAVNSVYGC